MDIRSVLARITAALDSARIDHALIGGLALAAHGAARATVDVDLLVAGDRDDEVDQLLREQGYACLHRGEHAANYASDDPAAGRVDLLFARREIGRAMLARATSHAVMGELQVPVVDAADLIGLKVQGYANDQRRRLQDMADIQRLLQANPQIDLERVRRYFRLFDREKELEEMLEVSR